MDNDGDYAYSNLTNAVKDKDSPLRRYLDGRFPNTRPVQAAYKENAGSLLVEGGSANPGTIGTAFDTAIRFSLDPGYVPTFAMRGFREGSPAHLAVLGVTHVTRTAKDSETFCRGVWALALCTEVYRRGTLIGSPLSALDEEGRFSTSELLDEASANALEQLASLRDVAERCLLPHLSDAADLALGPEFDGSVLCRADADLIADGVLLELKTYLGRKNSVGVRVDTLDLTDLYQLVGYALFDRSDAYLIRSLGFYSARYGSFIAWPLNETLNVMAGTPIDLAKERETVWDLLGGA